MNETTTPTADAGVELLGQAASGVRFAILALRTAMDANNIDAAEAVLAQLALAGARIEQGAAAAGHQLRIGGTAVEGWLEMAGA